MRPARCLIVDDESPARDELRYLLGAFDDVAVVGEAATADEARVLLESVRYDLVFLDIRMPGTTGLALAEELGACAGGPAVVFTTAYPDHAVEAFDLDAVDYLLKPFDAARLRRALDRVLETATDPEEPDDDDLPDAPAPAVRPGRIPVHRGETVVLVPETEVVYVAAARGYAHLKLTNERVLVSFTLNELQARLSDRFERTHRSYLVNLDRVRALAPGAQGGLAVVMADAQGSRVPVSRRRAARLRERLGM